MATFAYEMCNASDGRKIATGFTRHIFLTADFRPTKLPAKYFEFFGLR